MKKYYLLLFLFSTLNLCAQETNISILPGIDGHVPAIKYEYFPSRMHIFIWRNWTTVPKSRLAKVLNATEQQVEEIARSMGLPKQKNIQKEWLTSKGYITVLRRNWHLLPYNQLTTLLGISDEDLAWKLKEDDFLYVKLGNIKPYCTPLIYKTPTAEINQKANEISNWMKDFGDDAFSKEVPRFNFVKNFNKTDKKQLSESLHDNEFELRIIYPYFAGYGDPLIDPDLTTYPEGMFQKLSAVGINGIWMHAVLRTLVPPRGPFPGDPNASQRIQGLKNLVSRASKYGIKVYLYMNEPRSMNSEFFASSPERSELGGAKEGYMQAFCTSNPKVKEWLSNSIASVFRQVKGLGGVFTITGSENLTFCASHGLESQCKRCKHSTCAQLTVEVNKAIEQGIHSVDPNAKVIVWDWGWKESDCESIIRNLPETCWFMSVSEWAKPINRGGIQSVIGEYSISEVGPSHRTMQHWQWAKERGLKTIAKVQVNSSWELSPIPALPVLDLVANHAENLLKASTDGVMLSWSLGGYPSLNLRLFQNFEIGKKEQILNHLAQEEYGQAAVPYIRKAWTLCSEAFKEFPYHPSTLYNGPQHVGPSNPLYIHPTDYSPTMVGIPYDKVNTWCSIYPVSIWINQMQKVADGFANGSESFYKAQNCVKGKNAQKIHTEWIRCEVARIHFASSAQQARFYEARNRWFKEKERNAIKEMREAIINEELLVKQLLPLVKEDATIGYESSNHYFYLPIDLLEKYISIRHALNWLDTL